MYINWNANCKDIHKNMRLFANLSQFHTILLTFCLKNHKNEELLTFYLKYISLCFGKGIMFLLKTSPDDDLSI